jgi:hypothetical protein
VAGDETDREPEAPPPASDVAQRRRRLTRLFRSGALRLGGTTLNIVLGLVVTAIALAAWRLLTGTTKPISQQLAAILQAQARESRYAVVNRNVYLHGTGQISHLLVFRTQAPPTEFTASDEIRIYDETGSKLEEAFDFFPQRSRLSHYGLRFDLQSVKAVDNTDRRVILGSYATVFMNGQVTRPVIVDWNEATSRYEIHALLTKPLTLATKGIPDGFGGAGLYSGESLTDPRTGTTLSHAEGAEAFTVYRGDFPVLLAAFVAGANCHACPWTMQLKGWKIDLEAPNPQVAECRPVSGRPILFTPRSFADYAPSKLDALWVAKTHNIVDCH